MLFTSQVIAAASGSVGGLTASRNRYGQYFRTRVVPVNPNTPAQITVRALFAAAATAWKAIAGSERDAWDTYAINTPVLNKLGNSITLTGFSMYVRSNSVRDLAGLAMVDPGPSIFGLPDFTQSGMTASTSGPGVTTVSLAFDGQDDWVDEDDAAMIYFVSRPQSPTINFFKGPFRFLGTVLGDATTAPTPPVDLQSPFTGAPGQKIFVRARVLRADGRLSNAKDRVAISS